jgi:ATP-dependent Clp protease protease subunit
MFSNVKKRINAGIIDKIKEAAGSKKNKDDKIVLIDADALGGPPEPDMRSIGLFSDVSDEKVAEIVQAILYLNELNKAEKDEEKKKPIDFYICTYGGSADDMFALYDIINIIKQDTEIHTIGVGKVMSAGVLLLASGTQGKRKIGKHCRVMIHNVIGGNHGSLPNLANELEAIQTLQDDYVNALVENTKLTKKKLTKMLNEKVNVYLSAEEAVELGIADIII